MDTGGVDIEAAAAETIEYLTVEPQPPEDGASIFTGRTPEWFGPVLFGGFGIGQAVSAACQTAPEGKRIHSLHAYFIRPMLAGPPVTYAIRALRDGRSFSLRQLLVEQEYKLVASALCSFTEDTEGYEYELPVMSDVPGPTDAIESEWGMGAWERKRIGPSEPDQDGIRTSTARAWSKVATRLPDDPHLHAAMLGFLSDVTETGGRPRKLEGDIEGMVSLDHAIWFHRAPRVDEWLFYDVHSLVNTGGRGLLRGSIHTEDRKLAASVAQEMLLRQV